MTPEGGRERVRIVLADDHDIVRDGLRDLLEGETGWEVCGEARDGRSAVNLAMDLAPDVVILDVAMPELNGLEATRRIRAANRGTAVLIFTMHDSDAFIAEMRAAGAHGYLAKSDAPHRIVATVRALAAHEPFPWADATDRPPEASPFQPSGDSDGDPARGVQGSLTAREREVAQLLAEGHRNKAIARRLGVSTKTVEAHRIAIMRKVGGASIADLVRYAVRHRIAAV